MGFGGDACGWGVLTVMIESGCSLSEFGKMPPMVGFISQSPEEEYRGLAIATHPSATKTTKITEFGQPFHSNAVFQETFTNQREKSSSS
jgi:hypothetical protein